MKHLKHSLANSLYQDTVDLNDREAKMAVTCQSVASRWLLLIHDDNRNLETVYWFEFWKSEWTCGIKVKRQNWKKSIQNKNIKHLKHSLANSLYQDTVDLNDREAKMAVTCQSVASRWSLLIHDDDRNLETVRWSCKASAIKILWCIFFWAK